MITYRSLQNPRLCRKELRSTIHELPSLRWDRYFTRKCHLTLNGQPAIVRMLTDICQYVDCLYSDRIAHKGCPIGNAAGELTVEAQRLIQEIQQAVDNGRGISTRHIRPVTAAATRLYTATRGHRTAEVDCVRYWTQAGIASSVAFE
jgi:hypothetical protein